MKLVRRVCPICASDDYEEVVTLRQADFTTPNSTYRLDRLDELALDPEQLYPIVKCNHCRMIYGLYHLDDETEALVYNHLIDPDASLDKVLTIPKRISDLQNWMGLLSVMKTSRPGKIDLKVLDYGCGWGTLLLAARGPGVEVVGFDVTGWKIAWARDQGLTICTSVQELEAHAPFDVAISTSVLEHLRSPHEALADMTSVLKPGSYALITCIVPATAGEADWKEIRRRLSRGLPLRKEINPWEHLNYFTVETLSRLLSDHGFVPVEVRTHPDSLRRLIHGMRFLQKYLQYFLARLLNSNQGRQLPTPVTPVYWQLKKQ